MNTVAVVSGTIAHSDERWLVVGEDQTRVIYPQTREGDTIRVVIPKYVLRLRHRQSGRVVQFSRNLSQRKWYWHDSRDKPTKTTRRDVVVGEVARMLFGGDKVAAAGLVKAHLFG